MTLQQDIPYCRSLGVKVILSIGGVYDPVLDNYKVTDNTTATNFATFLYNAFGPYNSSWTGPRPFDASPIDHTAVDGFDFDLEPPATSALSPAWCKFSPLSLLEFASMGIEC